MTHGHVFPSPWHADQGPCPPAERRREKRARDRAKVWSPDEDLRGLSDTGLLEQLAIAFRKERN